MWWRTPQPSVFTAPDRAGAALAQNQDRLTPPLRLALYGDRLEVAVIAKPTRPHIIAAVLSEQIRKELFNELFCRAEILRGPPGN